MLFADAAESWWMVAMMAVAGLIGTAATWIYNQWSKAHALNRTERKEDEKGIVDHQKELIERQDRSLAMQEKENENLRGEIRKLWTEIREWEMRVVRLRSHVEYLEGTMQDSGMKFRPYSEPAKPVETKL